MKKKLPAGLVIVIAVLFMMTAVAAAVTNGFGLLRFYPEQAENTAFTDRIVSVGQTWEGKYFDAEIHEAVFDGSKLRFSMSVTPREGADQVYVLPSVKAEYEGRELRTSYCDILYGQSEFGGFWVPDMKPLIRPDEYDLNDMVYEATLYDWDSSMPITVSGDVQWTFTFNVLRTDWKTSFADSGYHESWSDEKAEAFRQLQYEAYDRQELLFDEWGYGLYDVILHTFTADDGFISEDAADMSTLDMYTKEVFTLEEQSVFSFVADRARIRKIAGPVPFVLPDNVEYSVDKADATMDGINVLISTDIPLAFSFEEFFDWPWSFVLKSDDAEISLITSGYSISQSDLNFDYEYSSTKPVSSVTLVPVQHTDDGDVERDDLAVVLNLE